MHAYITPWPLHIVVKTKIGLFAKVFRLAYVGRFNKFYNNARPTATSPHQNRSDIYSSIAILSHISMSVSVVSMFFIIDIGYSTDIHDPNYSSVFSGAYLSRIGGFQLSGSSTPLYTTIIQPIFIHNRCKYPAIHNSLPKMPQTCVSHFPIDITLTSPFKSVSCS